MIIITNTINIAQKVSVTNTFVTPAANNTPYKFTNLYDILTESRLTHVVDGGGGFQ